MLRGRGQRTCPRWPLWPSSHSPLPGRTAVLRDRHQARTVVNAIAIPSMGMTIIFPMIRPSTIRCRSGVVLGRKNSAAISMMTSSRTNRTMLTKPSASTCFLYFRYNAINVLIAHPRPMARSWLNFNLFLRFRHQIIGT